MALALQSLGQRMRKTHDMTVKVETQDDRSHIDQEFRIVLFNAVRELLLNVLKHANVKSAKVEMSMLPGHQVRIVVSDRGSGFARKSPGRRMRPKAVWASWPSANGWSRSGGEWRSKAARAREAGSR